MSNVLIVIILGVIQGLCEFLPVSSSGHLVLAQQFLGLKEPELALDLLLHIGTLTAVFIFYKKEIFALCYELKFLPKALLSPKFMADTYKKRETFRFGILILVGSIPTAVIGFSFKAFFTYFFSSILLVGIGLVATGFILTLSGKYKPKVVRDNLTLKDALFIGAIQGLAIAPGLSRSGFTISCGLLLGLKRELAARYSFLLSIPAILGGMLLELKDGFHSAFSIDLLALGFFISAIVGYAALTSLVKIIKHNLFSRFAYWCWFAGALAIIYSFYR